MRTTPLSSTVAPALRNRSSAWSPSTSMPSSSTMRSDTSWMNSSCSSSSASIGAKAIAQPLAIDLMDGRVPASAGCLRERRRLVLAMGGLPFYQWSGYCGRPHAVNLLYLRQNLLLNMSNVKSSRHIAFCLCPGFFAVLPRGRARRIAPREPIQWRARFIAGACLTEDRRRRRPTVAAYRWRRAAISPRPATGPICRSSSPDSTPASSNSPGCDAFLRRQARHGRPVGGISNGAFLLAAAGLLESLQRDHPLGGFRKFLPALSANSRALSTLRDRSQSHGPAPAVRRRSTCSSSWRARISATKSRSGFRGRCCCRNNPSCFRQPLKPCARARAFGAGAARAQPDRAGVGQAITVNRTGAGHRHQPARTVAPVPRELNSTPSRVLARAPARPRAFADSEHPALPMATIADSVGFSSQSHLTSSYHRRRFGMTPAQQRREYRAARDRLPLDRREISATGEAHRFINCSRAALV